MSLFQSPAMVKLTLKLLLFGDAGTGKTRLSKDFPVGTGKVAVIDTEDGWLPYLPDLDAERFLYLRAKDYKTVMQALEEIRKRTDVALLIIDPITIIYEAMVEGRRVSRPGANENTPLEQQDWGVIKGYMDRLYHKILSMPCNVIVTAREKEVQKTKKDDVVVDRYKPDAERRVAYLFDVVLQLTKSDNGYKAYVQKDRWNVLGQNIQNPTPASFKKLMDKVNSTASGKQSERVSEESAAAATGKAMQEDAVPKTPPQYSKPAAAQPSAGEATTQPAAPASNATPISAANGHTQAERPLQTEQLYDMLRRKAEKDKTPAGAVVISKTQVGILVSKLETFMSEETRHYLTDQVWGKPTAKQLYERERAALTSWIDNSDPADIEKEIKLVIVERLAKEAEAEFNAIAAPLIDIDENGEPVEVPAPAAAETAEVG